MEELHQVRGVSGARVAMAVCSHWRGCLPHGLSCNQRSWAEKANRRRKKHFCSTSKNLGSSAMPLPASTGGQGPVWEGRRADSQVFASVPSVFAEDTGGSPSWGAPNTGLNNSFCVSFLLTWGERGAGAGCVRETHRYGNHMFPGIYLRNMSLQGWERSDSVQAAAAEGTRHGLCPPPPQPHCLPSCLPSVRGTEAPLGSHCQVAPHGFSSSPGCGGACSKHTTVLGGWCGGHNMPGQPPSLGEMVISSCDLEQGLQWGHFSPTQDPAWPRAAGTGGENGHASGSCYGWGPGLGPHFSAARLVTWRALTMETPSPVCAAGQQQGWAVGWVWTCSQHGTAGWHGARAGEPCRWELPLLSHGTCPATGLQRLKQQLVSKVYAICNPCGFNVTGNVVI